MSENFLWLLFDTWRARRQGLAEIERRQRTRLAEMVAFARANSPYYRELYEDLPERVEDTSLLPITSKKDLMAHLNDWATDREVTIEKARAFVDKPDLIGERFLDKYTVATTSGTTGTRGIFLLDDRNIAVNNALTFARMMSTWLNAGDVIRILKHGGRWAMVTATGGHFLSSVIATRVRQSSRLGSKAFQIFSVYTPMSELVAKLNLFRPAMILGYASVIALLADEQEARRLNINPVLVQPAGEGIPAGEYDRIAKAFNAKVREAYSATECGFIAYSCEYRWLHINSDWVILEPVDVDYQPVPPGQQSHTVLISNLANKVQPILRYDLGDNILMRPDSCPCGNPLPAIRVQGRAADVLTFSTDRGEKVTIAPLVFGTIVDRIPGIERFQIVQTTSTNLRVRLHLETEADPERVWQVVHSEIEHLLSQRKLDHITIERAEESPEQSPGGKYREIIPLS
ncbi:MAG TPA: phenylacetate--CoA ligase family protein [Methanosarcina sp.]|nr:hypothetical protein [Methanolobus sp.]HIH75316.1 phenylacetate--CoA ligase family protein [Methanosarcina sp.]